MFETETFLAASLIPALLVAFSAGILSFLSPCVLPIVPPYLAYMGGVSVSEMEDNKDARNRAVVSALFFVLGLSTVFLILGAGASALGRTFLGVKTYFEIGAGIVVIIFGFHFLGLYRLKFLDREMRVDAGDQGGSAFGAYFLGLAFAFGWTPCLGPILSAILGLATGQADVGKGMVLLGTYALGLGVPFLLVAAFFPQMKRPMAWMKRNMGVIEKTSGVLLIIVGLAMATGFLAVFAYWMLEAMPFLAVFG
ncbi:cytochrome c-type biogenesis protein [Octadecabacter temperatus]|uniref:Thiol:disulfide interchange protein DsbD n=1 Tax=Octadecabacter temperatus TaxID=1458307 RepID=A0A0K0Y5W0_9RHOB|nr:cytochrome c biogenesis protein CcdA [Octadecabacter temperatus]AKS46310.1 Thiol:disulfide interchange protein DsbD precursor [Octadecabacter temperatus]SIO11690.1 cytochrome c-type biogenesis protein [Octadecabacter temperatus]